MESAAALNLLYKIPKDVKAKLEALVRRSSQTYDDTSHGVGHGGRDDAHC